MDVDAAAFRNVEQGLGEDAAVGEDDCCVRGEGLDEVTSLFGSDLGGLMDRDAEAFGGDLDVGRAEGLLAADGAVGLREHRREVLASVDEGSECRHGDGRGAHEDESHGRGGYTNELLRGPVLAIDSVSRRLRVSVCEALFGSELRTQRHGGAETRSSAGPSAQPTRTAAVAAPRSTQGCSSRTPTTAPP